MNLCIRKYKYVSVFPYYYLFKQLKLRELAERNKNMDFNCFIKSKNKTN